LAQAISSCRSRKGLREPTRAVTALVNQVEPQLIVRIRRIKLACLADIGQRLQRGACVEIGDAAPKVGVVIIRIERDIVSLKWAMTRSKSLLAGPLVWLWPGRKSLGSSRILSMEFASASPDRDQLLVDDSWKHESRQFHRQRNNHSNPVPATRSRPKRSQLQTPPLLRLS
jgi:hypothetical protein